MPLNPRKWNPEGESKQEGMHITPDELRALGGNDNIRIASIIEHMDNREGLCFEIDHDDGCPRMEPKEGPCNCKPNITLVHRIPLGEGN